MSQAGGRTLVCDIVVIGGGPAGSAAATTAALRGRDVVVLEKDVFPRYHIGESLLPYAWWVLERLGALDKVKAHAFQTKHSVRFATPDGRLSKPFTFVDHLQHEAANTWQVERSQFDELMLDHAASVGARVFQGTAVTGVLEEDGCVVGVTAKGPDGPFTVRSKVVIDASGRDGVVRTLRGWRKAEPQLQRVAVWSYFKAIPREEGIHGGCTTVASVPGDGWFWYIPLQNDIISVGLVAKPEVIYAEGRKDLQKVYERALTLSPWITEQVAGGTQVDGVHVTSDYSYRSEYCADDGVVLAGDAFSFLDPVFSSGVFLALTMGEQAAIAADEAIGAGDVSASAFAAYGERICAGMESMRALVISFYQPEFSMKRLMRNHPELRGDVTDLLIGHVFREYDELMRAMGEIADVPAPLPYGRARVQPAKAVAS